MKEDNEQKKKLFGHPPEKLTGIAKSIHDSINSFNKLFFEPIRVSVFESFDVIHERNQRKRHEEQVDLTRRILQNLEETTELQKQVIFMTNLVLLLTVMQVGVAIIQLNQIDSGAAINFFIGLQILILVLIGFNTVTTVKSWWQKRKTSNNNMRAPESKE